MPAEATWLTVPVWSLRTTGWKSVTRYPFSGRGPATPPESSVSSRHRRNRPGLRPTRGQSFSRGACHAGLPVQREQLAVVDPAPAGPAPRSPRNPPGTCPTACPIRRPACRERTGRVTTCIAAQPFREFVTRADAEDAERDQRKPATFPGATATCAAATRAQPWPDRIPA